MNLKQAVPKQPPRTVSKSTCSNVTENTQIILDSLTDAAKNLATVAKATGLNGVPPPPKELPQITMKAYRQASS
jgi:hypothetical protein